jgi:hypothetical protein
MTEIYNFKNSPFKCDIEMDPKPLYRDFNKSGQPQKQHRMTNYSDQIRQIRQLISFLTRLGAKSWVVRAGGCSPHVLIYR